MDEYIICIQHVLWRYIHCAWEISNTQRGWVSYGMRRPCLTHRTYSLVSALDQRPKTTTSLRLAPCQAMLRTPCSSHHLSHLLPTSNEMSRPRHTPKGGIYQLHTHAHKKNKIETKRKKQKQLCPPFNLLQTLRCRLPKGGVFKGGVTGEP